MFTSDDQIATGLIAADVEEHDAWRWRNRQGPACGSGRIASLTKPRLHSAQQRWVDEPDLRPGQDWGKEAVYGDASLRRASPLLFDHLIGESGQRQWERYRRGRPMVPVALGTHLVTVAAPGATAVGLTTP